MISLKCAIFGCNMTLDSQSMDKMHSKDAKIIDFGHKMMFLWSNWVDNVKYWK